MPTQLAALYKSPHRSTFIAWHKFATYFYILQTKARHSLSSIKHQTYYTRVKIDEHLTETIDKQRKYFYYRNYSKIWFLNFYFLALIHFFLYADFLFKHAIWMALPYLGMFDVWTSIVNALLKAPHSQHSTCQIIENLFGILCDEWSDNWEPLA